MEMNLARDTSADVHNKTVTATPLSSAIGAEVIGVDLRAPLSDTQFSQVLDTWYRHCVLLFRDQRLEMEDQLRFAERFGEKRRKALAVVAHNRSFGGEPFVPAVRLGQLLQVRSQARSRRQPQRGIGGRPRVAEGLGDAPGFNGQGVRRQQEGCVQDRAGVLVERYGGAETGQNR